MTERAEYLNWWLFICVFFGWSTVFVSSANILIQKACCRESRHNLNTLLIWVLFYCIPVWLLQVELMYALTDPIPIAVWPQISCKCDIIIKGLMLWCINTYHMYIHTHNERDIMILQVTLWWMSTMTCSRMLLALLWWRLCVLSPSFCLQCDACKTSSATMSVIAQRQRNGLAAVTHLCWVLSCKMTTDFSFSPT